MNEEGTSSAKQLEEDISELVGGPEPETKGEEQDARQD